VQNPKFKPQCYKKRKGRKEGKGREGKGIPYTHEIIL
jgi:hypothetical protein